MNEVLDDDINGEENKPEPKSVSITHLLVWGGVGGLGLFFRLQHWPGAMLLIMIGMAGIMAFTFNSLIKVQFRNIVTIEGIMFSLFWIGFLTVTAVRGRPFLSFYGVMMHSAFFILILSVYTIARLIKNRKKS